MLHTRQSVMPGLAINGRLNGFCGHGRYVPGRLASAHTPSLIDTGGIRVMIIACHRLEVVRRSKNSF